MAGWLDEMRRDLDELGHAPKVASLATVGPGATAECRSVVVRHIADDASLAFTSDGRSDKDAQVRANPSATLLFWLEKAKRQYRLAGTVAVLAADDPRRAEQWRRASDGARSLFLWPPPGRPRDPDPAAFPPTVSADVPVPANFEVLVLTPTRVETLDLGQTPHLRRRWSVVAGVWAAETVNP